MRERLKPTEILRLRLRHHWLARPPAAKPEEIVRHFGAMQAQDFGMAKWAVGLRGSTLTEADVASAFDAGAILRTHVLRPTWHFVTPADIRGLLRLTAPRIRTAMAYNDRQHGVSPGLLRRTERVIARALRGGRHLTRDGLQVALARHGLKLSGVALAHAMAHAELAELICSGPRRGKQFTYALLDERAAAAMVPGRDELLAGLARKYFQSHGPAMAQDFSWWSGLSLADARAGIEALGKGFTGATWEGSEYYFPSDTAAAPAVGALLLPNYDEYLVAYADRELMAGAGGSLPASAANLIFKNTIALKGVVVGTWRRTLGAGGAKVAVSPLAPLSAAAQRTADQAVVRYRAFLAGRAALRPTKSEPRSTGQGNFES
jgi:hypothetical protein